MKQFLVPQGPPRAGTEIANPAQAQQRADSFFAARRQQAQLETYATLIGAPAAPATSRPPSLRQVVTTW